MSKKKNGLSKLLKRFESHRHVKMISIIYEGACFAVLLPTNVFIMPKVTKDFAQKLRKFMADMEQEGRKNVKAKKQGSALEAGPAKAKAHGKR